LDNIFGIIYLQVEQYTNSCDKSTQTDFIYRETNVQVGEQGLPSTTTVEININHQIEELRQEQENVSQHQLNISVPPPTPEDEDLFFGFDWNDDNYGFMETYIFMD
jgi:hypothetical protein